MIFEFQKEKKTIKKGEKETRKKSRLLVHRPTGAQWHIAKAFCPWYENGR
jgi:hypothetical protein